MGYVEMAKGNLEVIVGPMFAGKSEELIRRINRLKYAKKNYVVFKPKIDNRYSETEVCSHQLRKEPSVIISSAKEILDHVNQDTEVVCIDEVQFFDDEIIDIIDDLANNGKRVIVAGLDMDFKGDPFMVVAKLLAKAEYVTKLTAICAVCGKEATMTQRLISGEPAKRTDPVVLVGASESYESRCRHCHKVK